MKTSIVLTCVALVLGGAVDALAQFTPITAKLRITTYTPQSDGTSQAVVTHEGFYYRSSSGNEMTTSFYVDASGAKTESGVSSYRDASTGKVYEISHALRQAKVMQQVSLPLAQKAINPPAQYSAGTATVNGFSCVGVANPRGRGASNRTSWWAPSLGLRVKSDSDFGGGKRMVQELYDIQLSEPPSSKFLIPSNYTVDESNCRGCDNNATQ